MNKLCGLLACLAHGPELWIVTGLGRADGESKKLLPPDVYEELVAREAKILADSLKGTPDDDHVARAKLAAVMIARFALEADKADTAGVEAAALKIAKALGNKDTIAEARKLAAALANGGSGGKLQPLNAKMYIDDVMDTMNNLRQKKKGGDGIHPDLQTSGPLKALNGGEEKIRSLAKKKLTETALKKSAKEMVLFGYQLAVLAEVVDDLAPAQKTKEWRDLSRDMRSAAIKLAEASQKKDADGIFMAGTSLDSSCSRCHSAFRK
jgi:hypothetical protein